MRVDDRLESWVSICERRGIAPGQMVEHLRETREFHNPTGQPGSPPETIQQKWEQIGDIVKDAEPDKFVGSTKELMTTVGLDSRIPRDRGKITYRLRNHPDLKQVPGTSGQWIKRLPHTSGNGSDTAH